MLFFYRCLNIKIFLKPTFFNNLLLENIILNTRCRFYAKKSFILNSKFENANNSVFFAQENKQLKEPEGSYLEEIFLKQKEKPKTSFQKGNVLFF